MISIIVATSSSNIIAVNGKIPWKCPGDLRHFKETTSGHNIIMGRKTWDSIGRKPLPNRNNFIITRNIDNFKVFITFDVDTHYFISYSIDEAISKATLFKPKDTFIIGGEDIYSQCLQKNIVDRIYLSVIDNNLVNIEGDNPVIKKFHFDKSKWNKVKSENRKGFKLFVFSKKY